MLLAAPCFALSIGTASFTWDAPADTSNLYGYRIWIYKGDAASNPDTVLKYDITKSYFDWDIPANMTVNVRVWSLFRIVNSEGDITVKLGGFSELQDVEVQVSTENPPTGLSEN